MDSREIARQAFARALRRRRIRRGISQEELALEGIARSHVSDLERGLIDPKLSTILQLARIFGVRASVIVAEVERNIAKLAPKSGGT